MFSKTDLFLKFSSLSVFTVLLFLPILLYLLINMGKNMFGALAVMIFLFFAVVICVFINTITAFLWSTLETKFVKDEMVAFKEKFISLYLVLLCVYEILIIFSCGNNLLPSYLIWCAILLIIPSVSVVFIEKFLAVKMKK